MIAAAWCGVLEAGYFLRGIVYCAVYIRVRRSIADSETKEKELARNTLSNGQGAKSRPGGRDLHKPPPRFRIHSKDVQRCANRSLK